jgi:hypothetical protein
MLIRKLSKTADFCLAKFSLPKFVLVTTSKFKLSEAEIRFSNLLLVVVAVLAMTVFTTTLTL